MTAAELAAIEARCETRAPPRAAGYRWLICALLLAATMANYTDRQVLGILAPQLETRIGWSESQYGLIVTAFSTAYAIGLLVWGGLIDRLGTRLGYAAAMTLWNVAAMAHALAATAFGFAEARFLLGLGAAGNFPAAIKTVAEWFPRKERALAIGIFNAGSNVGAIVAPILVPWLAASFGWKSAFLVTGALGFVWLGLWLAMYTRPPAEAGSAWQPPSASTKVPWLTLLRYRQTWAFLVAKTLTDPVWWFYLYWLPKFLELPEPYATTYRTLWNGWLRKKYGTTDTLRKAWNVGRRPLGQELLRNVDLNLPPEKSWNLERDDQVKARWTIEPAGPEGGRCLRPPIPTPTAWSRAASRASSTSRAIRPRSCTCRPARPCSCAATWPRPAA